MAERTTTTSTTSLTLHADGVLTATTTVPVHTLAHAQENVRAIAALLDGARAPLVIDLRQVREMPAEVNRYYASPEADASTIAVALVVGSSVSRLLGNMAVALTGLTRQKSPLRLFEDPSAAHAWAREQASVRPGAAPASR